MNILFKKIIGANNIYKLKTNIQFAKNPSLKEALTQNKEFNNKYQGGRCFILGNGPSLKNVNFSLLRDEYTFTVNQLPRNPQFPDLNTNFHVWADQRFFHIDENKPEDIELLNIMKAVNTDGNKPVVFYKYAAKNMIEHFDLKKFLNIRFWDQAGYEVSMIPNSYIDFTKLVPGFSTVIHYVICLAVYMGFKDIVLLGCDCTGIISTAQSRLGYGEKSTYGYQITENEKKRLEAMQALSSFRNEMLWQVNMFDCYAILDQYCKNHGARLRNATNPTLLETVERVSLDEVLME